MSAVAFAASDCSVYRRYQASTPENVRQTESMLADAGFHKIVVDPSDPDSLPPNLPRTSSAAIQPRAAK